LGHTPPPAKPPKPKIHKISPLTSIPTHNDSHHRLDTISEENIEPTQEINQDDGNSIPSLAATDDVNDVDDLTYHVKLADAPLAALANWVVDHGATQHTDQITNSHAPDPPFDYINIVIENDADDDEIPIYLDQQGCNIRKMHPAHIILKDQLQGDTGANCGATNDASILWHYKTLITPIPITTYSDDQDESSCVAIGTGIIKIIANDNTTTNWLMLHTPQSTGTILSPDRYMMDHPSVTSFRHQGNRDNTGSISFQHESGQQLTQINMHRRKDGLWFTTNPILAPPTRRPPPHLIPLPPPPDTPQIQRMAVPLYCSEVDPTATPPPIMKIHADHAKQIKNAAAPIRRDYIGQNTNWTSQLSKALQKLELWHQRMGHPASRTLRNTQKVIDGIPILPEASSIFCCPFCDKAKMSKSHHGGKHSTREAFLPGTAFHMDLGFLRGPDNLQEVLNSGATPTKTIQKSHDGYNCYLLIVDAASRYLWSFLLKNKDPPIDLVDKFLAKHGAAKRETIITTTTDGLLAKSMSFNKLCMETGYSTTEHDYEFELEAPDIEAATPCPHYTIRTDNGGELAGSDDFRQTTGQHGYILETTAPDTSNQNGLVERPHRTIKEKVRCLLYTAGLSIQFWSSALLHAVWLYNRTFHSSLDMSPYQAYTGRRPTVDGLLTFGTRVTPKKSRSRTTALDPNAHDGIFLGYRATMDNIIYWDVHTQRVKTAKHKTFDEVQYGTNPANRSPAAKHLLEIATGAPHHHNRTDNLRETDKPEYDQQPDSPLDANLQTILDSPLPQSAAAAKVQQPTAVELRQQLEMLDVTTNIFEPAVSETLQLKGTHDTLGLITQQHPEYSETVVFQRCHPGTVSHKTIRRWKSRLKGSIIRMIDDITIINEKQLKDVIRDKRRKGQQQVKVQFAQPIWSSMTGEGLPTLHFDQLNVIAHHLHTINTGEDPWTDKTKWPPITDESIRMAINKGLAIPKITRRKAMQTESWTKFRDSEWIQLDKYSNQDMFGEPCPHPSSADTVVLPWVWTYLYKIDPVSLEDVEKSRGTCNGGSRHGKIVTLAETYAACVEQPAHRMVWAIIAGLNYIGLGCDVSNAFAEAPPPKKPYFMVIDQQFRDWWDNKLKLPAIPYGYVLPVLKNLQGHPEAPRLWHLHIQAILLNTMGFDHTTHEPCLYWRTHPTHGLVLILRQVDDFIIGAATAAIALDYKQEIQNHMANPLNELGIIKRFNGIDIHQTKYYIKLSCETYIDKIVQHHGWQLEKAANLPVPMRNDTTYQAALELTNGPDEAKEQRALEHEMTFSYRQAIGELIFAMTICRLDISPALIKLAQYSQNPAKCHYKATKAVFVFLNATKYEGIYYWRKQPNETLPDDPFPTTFSKAGVLAAYFTIEEPLRAVGASDSTWANDRRHRRSTGGIVFLLAGGAIFYRTRLQPTVAQSSTEAEFAFMTDAGKAALYIRSIMEELGLEQTLATPISVDNRGARQLSNAQQPTRRTRHVDMKEFVILQWTEEERILYTDVPTALNPSDSLSKPTGRVKFYEHTDVLMGRRPPSYVTTPSTSPRVNALLLFSTYRNLHHVFISQL
jgi:hypothetical protein